MPKPMKANEIKDKLTKLELVVDQNHKELQRQQKINALYGVVIIVWSLIAIFG